MTWQTDTVEGYAQQLNDKGVGAWDPNGTSGNIYRGTLPEDVCPGIGIQAYRVGRDDPANPTTQLRMQFMLRAGSLGALDDLDAALYDALQGLHDVAMGVVMVTDTQSISAVPMGVDGNGNYERACNYAADLNLPDTALRAY